MKLEMLPYKNVNLKNIFILSIKGYIKVLYQQGMSKNRN